MKLLIKDCILISMDEKREKIEDEMDILVIDDTIAKIEKEINEDVDIIIDARKKVLMPGLINTHSHVPMSIFRETISNLGLQDWLENRIWPMEDKLTEEDIFYSSYLSFLEMIRTGTTMINDMYFVTEKIIEAMEETGVRLQTTRALMDVKGEKDGEERLKELEYLINKYQNNSLVTFNAGIHGLYTASGNYVDKCIKFAKDKGLPVHIHFCENEKEIEDIKNLQRNDPISILKEKFQDVKTILAHGVKISKEDLELIKDMDISISHCPISNLKLGCGIAKINTMLEDNINVSLGTDGQGSGSNFDMFEVMKYTSLLQKGILEDPTKVSAYDVLRMATINGAKALGLSDKIGSIEVGKKADLILIDTDTILTRPRNDLISQIVYNIKGYDVDTTIVNGKILMENKTLKDKRVQEIISKCEEIIKRISKI